MSKVLLRYWLPFEAQQNAIAQGPAPVCFPRLGILVELVQGIEAAEAGPCVHALRVHPTLFVRALDCHGLVLDVHEGNPVHGILVVGDLHPACVGGESSGLGSGASGLIPNLDEKRVLVDKLQKVHLGACARPGHPDGAARVRSHLWVQEPVQALSLPSTGPMLVPMMKPE